MKFPVTESSYSGRKRGKRRMTTGFALYTCKTSFTNNQWREAKGGFVDSEQEDKDKNPKVVVPHGFRATFETWAVNETRHDQVTIDIALDHKTSQDMHDALPERCV